eukprot:6716761-Prymnesium_polylepis.1
MDRGEAKSIHAVALVSWGAIAVSASTMIGKGKTWLTAQKPANFRRTGFQPKGVDHVWCAVNI